MNIVMVGFMGSGKSVVGRIVAKRLGYALLDTDHLIEKKGGCTIAELFEKKGEPYFRQLETRLITEIVGIENYVISTGGGLLTTSGNMDLLKKLGVVVFLNAEKGDILERLARDTRRPKLKEGGLEETVNRLLEERMPLYMACDLSVETHGKSIRQIAGEVINRSLGFSR